MAEKSALSEYKTIKKAVIPIAGLGTRFLPLSRIVAKEVWPLVDQPMVYYSASEAVSAGIKEIIFIISSEKKQVPAYFKDSLRLEKLLKETKKNDALEEVKSFSDKFKDIAFNYVFQKKPLGDGQAVLTAKDLVGDEPFMLFFPDDIVDSQISCAEQLLKTFKTCQKTIVGLKRITPDRISSYGTASVEKIANRLYKIKKIIEKPKQEEAPSDLVHIGRSIITPDTFAYLKRGGLAKGEIRMVGAWNEMLNDGKAVYGYEFEGEWLECGNKLAWLKSFFYLALKDKRFGQELKKYLKEINK